MVTAGHCLCYENIVGQECDEKSKGQTKFGKDPSIEIRYGSHEREKGEMVMAKSALVHTDYIHRV